MKKLSQVDRSNSMENDYNISSLPKSGFNLTYNSHAGGLVLGRLYPTTYQHIMSGDKFSGKNEYSLTFEQLATPVVSDVNVSQHNYFVTYRAIDKGWEDLMTPTKLNSMSQGLSVPTFTLKHVAELVVTPMAAFLPYSDGNGAYDNTIDYTSIFGTTLATFATKFSSAMAATGVSMAYSYCNDSLNDLINALAPAAIAISTATTNAELEAGFQNFWHIYFDFWCGEGSLMDYLGYNILKHTDVDNLLDSGLTATASGERVAVADFISDVDERGMSEYALRAAYAIWFEYYRVQELEPRSDNLPEYRTWSSTALMSTLWMHLLPLRVRSWSKDPFTTAQIDDMCRHVYAPIISQYTNFNTFSSPSAPAQSAPSDATARVGNLWSSSLIRYIDTNGVSQTITCPLPQALSSLDFNFDRDGVSAPLNGGLDLFTLKKAHMLERYLKRNLAFGDEYRDRIKAHYDVTIEDYRINRPLYMSGSVSPMSVKQEVANSGAAVDDSTSGLVKQGARMATATAASSSSDGFELFATEFGIYIGFTSIMPQAQYDYTCPQHFLTKTQDFPTPEFAMQQEDIMNTAEIYRVGTPVAGTDNVPFGHVPYAHAYRYRVNDVHGQMLSSKYDYTFCRFYKGLTSDGVPKLNYQFIHCRPNIPMFVDTILLDGQVYGTFKHNFLVERLLPQPVETI